MGDKYGLVIPFDEYLNIDAMNASTLIQGLKSMKRMKWYMDTQRPETPQQRLGSAAHALLSMTSEQFADHHIVIPDYHLSPDNVTDSGKPSTSKNTKWVANRVEEFREQTGGRQVITKTEWKHCLNMLYAVEKCGFARELKESCASEVTVLGTIDGVACKSRFDLIDESCWADYKTTPNVESSAFGRQFTRLNIGFRMAFYRRVLGCDRPRYLITIEKQDEYDCTVVPVHDAELDNYDSLITDVIRRYKHAKETDIWPGVDGGERLYHLKVPQWGLEDAGIELQFSD